MVSEVEEVKIIHGDCIAEMAAMSPDSMDTIICDPPYGLEFMGRDWDTPQLLMNGRRRAKGDDDAGRNSRLGYETGWKYGMSGYGFSDGVKRLIAPSWRSRRNPCCKQCKRHKRGQKESPGCECAKPDFDETEHRIADFQYFQEWCTLWAKAALRVAKPGAHLLAFGGTRTYHRLACAIEDAGWEIRDTVLWLYGQGFPKGISVGKAMDSGVVDDGNVRKFQDALRRARCQAGITRAELSERVCGSRTGACWNWESGLRVPNGQHWRQIVQVLNLPKELEQLRDSAEREVVGAGTAGLGVGKPAFGGGYQPDYDITMPATDRAKHWNGWNTTLKPAFEPIVLAQKPLDGSVAQNALKHGVAGLWIDGCRIGYANAADKAGATPQGQCTSKESIAIGAQPDAGRNLERVPFDRPMQLGRWPANLILSHSPDCHCIGTKTVKNKSGSVSGDEPSHTGDENAACYGEYDRVPFQKHGDANGNETVERWECLAACVCGHAWLAEVLTECPDCDSHKTFWACPVAELNQQSGVTKTRRDNKPSDCGGNTWGGTIQTHRGLRGYTDQGGASRFFFCAKALRSERGGYCDHPTVKPLALMRWLCRLTKTPTGGVVLDPFCGSGSTLIAAQAEGRRAIGIDQDEHACEIAVRRCADRGIVVQQEADL